MRSPFTPSGQDGRVGCCHPGGQPERQPVVDTHCFYCLTPFTLLVTSIQPPSWGITSPSSPCTSDRVGSTQTPRVVPKAEARPMGTFPPQHSWFRAEHVIDLSFTRPSIIGQENQNPRQWILLLPSYFMDKSFWEKEVEQETQGTIEQL